MWEEELVTLLNEKKYVIATAESCTGGMVASKIVNVSGASEVFQTGFVTYANETKMKYLGVNKNTLEQFGAVSEETVREMAEGCARETGADVTVVTSGIAGPGGGTEDKPVGLVWFGCFYDKKVYVTSKIFPGNRLEIREAAANHALKFTLDIIKN